MPEVNLSNNSEYEYCWALVDSGAGANVAKCNGFTESETVPAPPLTLSTANGEILPHAGARRVTSYTQDGQKISRTFYEANVEMPILAVSELSREGRSGSEVRLRRRDGYLEDLHTGQRQHIVKRRGVYFMKMYTRKGSTPGIEAGFTRPSQP